MDLDSNYGQENEPHVYLLFRLIKGGTFKEEGSGVVPVGTRPAVTLLPGQAHGGWPHNMRLSDIIQSPKLPPTRQPGTGVRALGFWASSWAKQQAGLADEEVWDYMELGLYKVNESIYAWDTILGAWF